MSIHCSARQISILRTVAHGNWLRAEGNHNQIYRSALRLHDKGLIDRDPKDAYRFTSNAKGDHYIEEHDAALAEAIK